MTGLRLLLLATLILLVVSPADVYANLVMPLVLALPQRQFSSVMTIVGIVIEYVFIRKTLHTPITESARITVIMNAYSSFLGLIVTIGLPHDAIIEMIGYASIFEWIYVFILFVLINTCIETYCIRKVLHQKTDRPVFCWLLVANGLSVGCLLLTLPQLRQLVTLQP